MATTLPVELLRKIFKTCLPTREEAIEKGRISFLDVPWSLTRVSSQWRAVALDMPSLWASLTIAIEHSTPSWLNYPLRLVEAQLFRSGTHPLQIVFISKEAPGYTTQKLFRIISRSSDRWETLELDSVWRLGHALPSIQGKLSLLREMYICTERLPSDVFRSAPNLRIARIVNPNRYHDEVPVGSRNIELPWAQLTVFESTYRDRLQFEGMLLAPNLVECQITVPLADSDLLPWQAPAQPTVFPHLKKLVLEAPVTYLDALCLPALEALEIRTSLPFEHLVRMLQRSACSLKRFWMKARPPVEHILPLLMHNPQIFELGLLGSRFDGPVANTDAIIRALTLGYPDGPPQPVYATALTSLTVRDHPDALNGLGVNDQSHNVNMKAVIDMVESRVRLSHLHGCSRLEEFCVFGSGVRILQAEFKARLTALQADGLRVEIGSDHDPEYRLSLRAELFSHI
ncbi:hypothetical protein DFH06DRAFT_1223978 [Mycena polygramma]|nr:hypothetical protein DFH06DRAFT_1223978 [Mycena polygramma]